MIRCRDEADVQSIVETARDDSYGCRLYPHGALLFAHIPGATSDTGGALIERVRHLEALASGRPLGAELLCDDWDEAEFIDAKQRLGVELPTTPRLQVLYYGGRAGEDARHFAAQVTEADARAHAGCVLIEGIARRKRLAVLALRQGADVTPLDGTELDVSGFFWFLEPPRQQGQKAPPPPTLDPEGLGRELSDALGTRVHAEPGPPWQSGARVRVRTADPARALAVIELTAERLGTQLNLGITDVDPLAFLLRRLMTDVGAGSGR